MYNRLVDLLVDIIDDCPLTGSEMKEAFDFAHILYEQRNPLPGPTIIDPNATIICPYCKRAFNPQAYTCHVAGCNHN